MVEKNRKMIIISAASFILLILSAIGAKFYFFPEENEAARGNGQDKFSDTLMEIKPLKPDMLSSAKFLKLKEYQPKSSPMDELEIGKDNPFEPSSPPLNSD